MEYIANILQANMEEANPTPVSEGRSDVGFPDVKKEPKKSKLPIIAIIILILLFVAGGAFFIFSKPGNIDDETMEEGAISSTPTTTITPTPSVMELKRNEVSISVLNGTSVSGLAGKVKTALEKLGYAEIETGNASKKDYEVTEVKFASSVTTAAKEEILAELNKTFEEVKTVSGTPTSVDVEIITGFPKGHTVTPTVKATTATPKPTGSVTPTPTGTVTATGTVTVTPTKTPTPSQTL